VKLNLEAQAVFIRFRTKVSWMIRASVEALWRESPKEAITFFWVECQIAI